MMLKVWFVCLAMAAFLVQAQDMSVKVMESEALGSYLTDADGNSLYMFINEDMDAQDPERMTEGVRSNAAPCADKCLEFWPPLTGSAVQAGEGVDAELLYIADFGGMPMAVYNGWPLYYFIKDEKAGDTNGQGSGKAPNIWYLLNADGSINETVVQ
jgi:predicted lipoprotein with Yx(FWY)xxD motif